MIAIKRLPGSRNLPLNCLILPGLDIACPDAGSSLRVRRGASLPLSIARRIIKIDTQSSCHQGYMACKLLHLSGVTHQGIMCRRLDGNADVKRAAGRPA